jgi:hypothetical protein
VITVRVGIVLHGRDDDVRPFVPIEIGDRAPRVAHMIRWAASYARTRDRGQLSDVFRGLVQDVLHTPGVRIESGAAAHEQVGLSVTIEVARIDLATSELSRLLMPSEPTTVGRGGFQDGRQRTKINVRGTGVGPRRIVLRTRAREITDPVTVEIHRCGRPHILACGQHGRPSL